MDQTSYCPSSASCPSPRVPRALARPRGPARADAAALTVAASGEAEEPALGEAEGLALEAAVGAGLALEAVVELVAAVAAASGEDAAAALVVVIEADTKSGSKRAKSMAAIKRRVHVKGASDPDSLLHGVPCAQGFTLHFFAIIFFFISFPLPAP